MQKDLANAMIYNYNNYEKYTAGDDQMRQWVIDNYSPDALGGKHIYMVKPKISYYGR